MYEARLMPLLAALLAIAGIAAAGSAVAAGGKRTASVAGGEQVTLAKSRFSSRELKARRPQMEKLIPRAR